MALCGATSLSLNSIQFLDDLDLVALVFYSIRFEDGEAKAPGYPAEYLDAIGYSQKFHATHAQFDSMRTRLADYQKAADAVVEGQKAADAVVEAQKEKMLDELFS